MVLGEKGYTFGYALTSEQVEKLCNQYIDMSGSEAEKIAKLENGADQIHGLIRKAEEGKAEAEIIGKNMVYAITMKIKDFRGKSVMVTVSLEEVASAV